MPSSDKAPKVLAFLCAWAPYRCYLETDGAKIAMPPQVYPIKVPCGGRIDPGLVLAAFEKGAAGVVVVTCKEGDCRHGRGPELGHGAAKRIAGLVHLLGIGPERFKILTCGAHESDKLARSLASFVEEMEGADPARTPSRAVSG